MSLAPAPELLVVVLDARLALLTEGPRETGSGEAGADQGARSCNASCKRTIRAIGHTDCSVAHRSAVPGFSDCQALVRTLDTVSIVSSLLTSSCDHMIVESGAFTDERTVMVVFDDVA